ncbi:MAG: GNAT family N-acetyltransferase [Clostridia bacterium]|nr:GNAT family N-acetyltransferase [Clostridia bacterium]
MRLKLHVPGLKDMSYRQGLLADPDTMSYNAMNGFDAEGYDPSTGCIDFPVTDWRYWRDVWLYREPARYSAYLLDEDTGCFVGEICYYYDMERDSHNVGVIIEHKHRNKGYATEGLKLITEYAFRREEIDCLHVDLPLDNEPALRAYMTAGFREVRQDGGTCHLILRKEGADQ